MDNRGACQQYETVGRLQMESTGGSMMPGENVKFIFTHAGKWNRFTVNTLAMLNGATAACK